MKVSKGRPGSSQSGDSEGHSCVDRLGAAGGGVVVKCKWGIGL